MREAERLGPVAAHRGLSDQGLGVARRAAGRRGPDRLARGRDAGQAVAAEESEPPHRAAREPAPERRTDPLELGATAGDGDDRDPRGPAERVEVEHVEPADDRPVEEDRADPFPAVERREERADAGGPVRPVDRHAADPHLLDAIGERDHDGGDRSLAVAAPERPVVHPDDAGMGLPERSPQR